MSRDGSVELDWGDGTYVFRLAWGELRALQEACDAGPFVIRTRLLTHTWRVDDISHTIRLGLIGGGMKPDKALQLVRTYVESRPPLENVPLAAAVLGVAIEGAPDEPPGERSGGAMESGSTTSQTENSASQ